MLFGWLLQPHVAAWWRDVPVDLAAVEAEYGPCIDGDGPTELFVATCDGRPTGMIQRYLIADEPDWTAALAEPVDISNAVGIDYLIGVPDLERRVRKSRPFRQRPATSLFAPASVTAVNWMTRSRSSRRMSVHSPSKPRGSRSRLLGRR